MRRPDAIVYVCAGRTLQLHSHLPEKAHVVRVDVGQLGEILGLVLVVRRAVVRARGLDVR